MEPVNVYSRKTVKSDTELVPVHVVVKNQRCPCLRRQFIRAIYLSKDGASLGQIQIFHFVNVNHMPMLKSVIHYTYPEQIEEMANFIH